MIISGVGPEWCTGIATGGIKSVESMIIRANINDSLGYRWRRSDTASSGVGPHLGDMGHIRRVNNLLIAIPVCMGCVKAKLYTLVCCCCVCPCSFCCCRMCVGCLYCKLVL